MDTIKPPRKMRQTTITNALLQATPRQLAAALARHRKNPGNRSPRVLKPYTCECGVVVQGMSAYRAHRRQHRTGREMRNA